MARGIWCACAATGTKSRVGNRQSAQRHRSENEMRIFVASLIVLAVLYFWDKDYNNSKLLDGLDSMRRAISHSTFR
jgi:hypothetical protein